MDYSLKAGQPEKQRCGCLVIGIAQGRRLSAVAQQIDTATDGAFSQVLKRSGFSGESGKHLLIPQLSGCAAEHILVLGAGKDKERSPESYRSVLAPLWEALSPLPNREVIFAVGTFSNTKLSVAETISGAVEVIEHRAYTFNAYKSKADNKKSENKKIAFLLDSRRSMKGLEDVLSRAEIVAQAVRYARDLGNTPPNVCNPTYMASQSKLLAKQHKKISIKIVEEAEMEKLGMGAFLSVTRGSTTPAKLITITYNGGRAKEKPVVFVGKGITFDTGGLSLKPPKSMVTMKYDMLGSATVLALMEAVACADLPLNVVGVLACAENCIGPDATKPDAVVTSLSGQTIEITNTDAEGRLVLCDALTYCEQYDPAVVINIATLTGGVIVALGDVATGLMSNDPALAKALKAAGNKSLDWVWELPIWQQYAPKLKSQIADFKNEAGFPSSVLAGVFLSQFTKNLKWAHLDVAGTAFSNEKLATGRPVSLLMQYLFDRLGK